MISFGPGKIVELIFSRAGLHRGGRKEGNYNYHNETFQTMGGGDGGNRHVYEAVTVLAEMEHKLSVSKGSSEDDASYTRRCNSAATPA